MTSSPCTTVRLQAVDVTEHCRRCLSHLENAGPPVPYDKAAAVVGPGELQEGKDCTCPIPGYAWKDAAACRLI